MPETRPDIEIYDIIIYLQEKIKEMEVSQTVSQLSDELHKAL
jgi:hypothetical protein